jgi:HK97 gp10 family phage protein
MKGLHNLLARLREIEVNLQDVTPTIQRHSAEMKGEMQANAPVKTGYLRNHIVEKDLNNGARIESQAPYSGYPEYGTSRMRPRSFWWRVLHPGLPRLFKKIKNVVMK